MTLRWPPRRSWRKTPTAMAVLMTAGLGVAPMNAADPPTPPPTPIPADTGVDRIIVTGGGDERAQEINLSYGNVALAQSIGATITQYGERRGFFGGVRLNF